MARKPELSSLLPEWLQDFVEAPLCQPNPSDPSAPPPPAELRQPPPPVELQQPPPPVGSHQTPVPEPFLGTRLALGGSWSIQRTSRPLKRRSETPVMLGLRAISIKT
ncbi:uncharacterized protein LOC115020937 [Cottoperca gobio]|uniref:Uncharacterized protein LOC115020937 n=1 Tax=Cottoperca gobio TaxID=56716 RepID=A0A6J2R9A5_COTGO|nr:uncharacterized protein LOC115020937 [Cottoperca gobio]